MQIGLQTYTIRKELKNRDSMYSAFKKIKDLGITSIEIARIPFTYESVRNVQEISRELGIKIKASQFKLSLLEKDFDFTVAAHKQWNCKLMAVSVIPTSCLLKGPDGFKELAERLNKLGERSNKEGIELLYHHHHFEFGTYRTKTFEETTGFHILNELLDFEKVAYILDTYWIQRSGYDPVKHIYKLSGNVKVLHLRDYIMRAGIIFPSVDDTYLGNGTLDFRSIINAAKDTGIKHLSIEQNSSVPFQHIEQSIQHLKSIGMDIYMNED